MNRFSWAASSAAKARTPKMSSSSGNRRKDRIGNVRLASFRRSRQQIAHGFVAELGEILVELAHAAEPIGRKERDRLVRGSLDFAKRLGGTNRNRDHDFRRILLP